MEDIRNFYKPVTEIKPDLICKICTAVALNAQECNTCENLFCEDCIKYWKRKQDQCPSNCKGPFSTKQPHRMVRDELSKIAFKCFYISLGCNQQILMNDVQKHANDCQFKKVACKCGWVGPQNKKSLHEQQCVELQTKKCQVCKDDIKATQFQNHNCINDLKTKIERISEKFQDYKELSDFNIKELKSHASQETNEIQSLKQQIQKALNENIDLKKQSQTLMELFISSEQKLNQVIESQKVAITQGQLVDSNSQSCSSGHKLQYWVNSKGEERTKQCFQCSRTQTSCRYFCNGCKQFYCLNCKNPELFSDPIQQTAYCPIKHRLTKRIQGLRCSICQKTSQEMRQPGGADCTQCDFAICFECLENHKYEGNRVQSCPVQ